MGFSGTESSVQQTLINQGTGKALDGVGLLAFESTVLCYGEESRRNGILTMNITFLIGNGFDLNLGLQTRYSDFIEWVNSMEPSRSDAITAFQKSIKEYCDNSREKIPVEINWCDAEVAFGQFTYKFRDVSDGDEQIDECHTYICEKLSDYLGIQARRLSHTRILADDFVLQGFVDAFIKLEFGLRPVDEAKIKDYINNLLGGLHIRTIVFNYTDIIDQLISQIIKKRLGGRRRYKGEDYPNIFYKAIHVHGFLNHGLIFGVDNESQMCGEIFKNEEPERKRSIIKKLISEDMGEAIDDVAMEAIDCADLIVIYGMSIGETDHRWWKTIIEKMIKSPKCVLIVQDINVPDRGIKPAPFMKYCRVRKDEFLKHVPMLSEVQRDSLINRIYFTNYNVFSALEDVVNNSNTKEV